MSQPDIHTLPAPGIEEQQYEDYFGFSENQTWYFPDGKQYLELKIMTEGDRSKFQKLTTRDFVLDRKSGDAKVKADPAAEREALLTTCVVDWFVVRRGERVPFSPQNLRLFIQAANPKLIDEIEKAIRKANPWMLGDMTVADIDKEIENLQEMREVAVERERGEADSSSK